MFIHIRNSGNASLYSDFSGKQFGQFIQLLQEDTGIGPGTPGSTGGRHKPIADGNISGQKAKRITLDDIRLSDVTYCPKTWRFDAISPASRCNCKAADIASCGVLSGPILPENDPITELTRVSRYTRGNVGGGVGPRMPDPPQQ